MKNKFLKLLSIVLAIAVVFSCCAISFGTTADEGTTATYYLDSKNGSDDNDGLTTSTAFLTYKGAIAKAVAAAEAGGYNTADSTVYFKIAATGSTTQWYSSGESSAGAAAHNFKLIITTDGTPTQAFMGSGTQSIELNGPTVFEKCYFDYGRGATAATMAITDSLTINSSAQDRIMAGPTILGSIGNVGNKTFDKPITFVNNSGWVYRRVVIGNELNATYDADINITWNSSCALPFTDILGYNFNTHRFEFGSMFAAGYTSTFNKNINFNLLKADSVTLAKAVGEFAFGPDAAVQILNATGKAVNYDEAMQAALFGAEKQVDTYVLNNNTGVTDLVAFTDKAGEYLADTDKFEITATPVDGGEAIKAKDGKLVVPAGEYELSYDVPAKTATYYVSAAGSDNNDGAEGTPFKTIGGALTAAVAAAKAGNFNYPNSTVYLKVLGTDSVDCSALDSIAYDFTLNISSANEAGTAVLGQVASSKSIFNGPTVVDNITLKVNNWGALYGTGKDLIFTEKANVIFNGGDAYLAPVLGGATVNTPVNFAINDTGTNASSYFAMSGATSTFNKDVNITFNGPKHGQTMYLTGINTNTNTNMNANLNIHVKGTAGFTFGLRGSGKINFAEGTAFQFINSSGSSVSYSAVESMLPADTYIITNNTGIKDIVKFTETAGTFAVDTEKFDVTATPVAGGEAIEAANGKLILTPGEYTLSVEMAPREVAYYVSADGNDSANGALGTPFQTIGGALTAAIADANANLYNASNSTVTLKLLTPYYNGSDEAIAENLYDLTSASDLPFNFKLIIATDSSLNKQAGLSANKFVAGGDIEFKNVTFNMVGSKQIYFNGKNVKMDSDVNVTGLSAGSYFTTGTSTGTPVFSTPQTVYYTNKAGGAFQFFTFGSNKATTYNADVTLVYDAPKSGDIIMLDAISRNTFATINKNMNINLVSGSPRITTRNYHSESTGGLVFGNGAAFQMINSTGNNVNYDDVATYLPAKKYIITNLTGVKDIIEFTETAGTFAVDTEKYNVTATAEDGTEILAADGKLVLTPGKYVLTRKIVPVTKTYYISASTGNNGNAGTKAAPFETLGGALTKVVAEANANDFNFENCTVNFEVLDTEPVVYSDASDITFKFALNIYSKVEGASFANGEKAITRLGGKIKLENIAFKVFENDNLYLTGNDFVLGDGASIVPPERDVQMAQTYFVLGAGASSAVISESQDINYVNNSTNGFTFFALGGSQTTTYNADINMVYQSPAAAQEIRLSSVGGGTAYYNGSVNLNIKSARRIKLSPGNTRYAFGANSALQILNSSGSDINYSDVANTLPSQTYIINNASGIKDLLAYTDKVGVYAVDSDKYQVTAVAENGTSYTSKNGLLTVNPGEYDLIVKSGDGSVDYLNKMLYFYTSGGTQILSSQMYVTPGETYRYTFNTYCTNISDMKPYISIDGTSVSFENIKKTNVGDYYTVTADVTVPSSCKAGSGLVGVNVSNYMEGLIFDRSFYKLNDASKTDYIVENQKFLKGLDGVKLNGQFWGGIYTGESGGAGRTYWTNGAQVLKIVNYETNLIDRLKALANPNDTSWANKALDDINGIAGFDIRDLVFASTIEGVDFTDAQFNSVAEKNKDNIITAADISIIRKELLTGVKYVATKDFSYEGYAKTQRDALLNTILKAPNTLNTYGSKVTGTVYYVSSLNGSDSNTGKSESSPFRHISKVESLSLKAGDAVLFERGSVFRLSKAFNCVQGVTYGAYGTGDKPQILGSVKYGAGANWTPSGKKNVWKIDYTYKTISGAFFNNGNEIGYVKNTLRSLHKNMDVYLDEANDVLYLYCDKGNPANVWNSIELSQADVHIDVPAYVNNVIIDNLALKYMGTFGVSCDYDNHYITVTNCEIGYIGGTKFPNEDVRYGNGIQAWCGGSNLKWDNNWIYQVFDSAVSPQGTVGKGVTDYYNISISGNLFEYNNADIEIWESGSEPADFYNWTMDNNIHRFTTLGWGTRKEEGNRGIQGVVVGGASAGQITGAFSWNNNIIDCPSDYIYRFSMGSEATYKAFERKNNTYYIDQSMRFHNVLAVNMYWENGVQIDNVASNKQETVAQIAKLEPTSKVYWYE